MNKFSKNTNIINRSFKEIVDHIQNSIDTLPKILELTDTCKSLNISIEAFVYSPTIEYISLALKFNRNIDDSDKEYFIKLSNNQKFKIIIMSQNQLIVKYLKH